MIKFNIWRNDSRLAVNTSVEGETIEEKIVRFMDSKEGIKDTAPIIHTERREGVRAGTNIRTDRFEVAVEAMDKIAKAKVAVREGKADIKVIKGSKDENGQNQDGEGNGTGVSGT